MPASRRWLWPLGLVALLCSFAQSPGQISPDTKLDLTANPGRFLARAAHLWNTDLPFGQVQNQAYGYLFPHGAFFTAGDLLGLPGWVTQRLWWALLLTAGFWGLLRVAEALNNGRGIGTPTARVIGAAAFALSPRVLTTLGSISSETLPMMLAPWVLLPVIRALHPRTERDRRIRVLAAQAGVAVALMGAVNAVATLAGCLPALIWWVCHRPTRLWWRFTGWWLLSLTLAITWWVVALVLLGRVSPPFLDFIESSRVTTQWMSLVEMLRGTHSWTPFVAPAATAGAPLVTRPVLILGTCLVAAGGLAGLTGLVRHRVDGAGRLVTMLLIGVALLAAGYNGGPDGLGSPLAAVVQAFLDGAGAPLRNVQKLESVIRLPLVLGLVHLLGRVPLPGSAPPTVWRRAFTHPEQHKSAAVGLVVLTALMVSTSLAWTGRLTAPGAFSAIPQYWRDAADWLVEHNPATPTAGRVLVVPGAPFATQVWGTSHDEPLQVLAAGPWGVRDSIPLTPPQTIRALDSVQRLIAAGRPSVGLADTLARQGISYLVLRNDLDPDTSRSARPILVHRAVDGSPGLTRVAEFGAPVGAGTVEGFVSDGGLRPRYPAVQIYAVSAAFTGVDNPGAPYLVDTDRASRVDGGPEVLLRLDEHRRLRGQPPLGPVLLTADARRAGLPTPVVTVTDTPLARETDYGRVDHHSSAIRAAGDPRHTHNRVPDYPSPGASTVFGDWVGGRLSASSSSSDATALPDVAPATSPAATVDSDPATAWVSNALQAAVGQWLQVDFDRPVTNATITITPSATAVGAQIRRIEVSTVNGTTTLRFDHAGEPLTAALPYGETPWVRITAAGTDDGSPGVQFGITELAVTQYDASGFAHPVDLRHTVVVPAAPPGAQVAAWDLGAELLGRPGCAAAADGVHCAASMMLDPEEPVTFSRTLNVGRPVSVTPTLWLRPRPGPQLVELIAEPGAARTHGDADVLDVQGSAYAAADGDPATAWMAPQRAVAHKTPPTLTLALPRPTEVTGLRLTPAGPPVPARPRLVAVDLGDGPQVRELPDRPDPSSLPLRPRVTETVTVSLLDWDDVIDRTALGFDQLKAPGLAEVTALGPGGRPIAPADPARNRSRKVTVGCEHGPVIAVAGRFVHTSVTTTVGALLDGAPVPAQVCDPRPIALAPGEQELLISPGAAFVVDSAQLSSPLAADARAAAGAAARPAATAQWDAARRQLQVPGGAASRLLVVPESSNPGWVAHSADGARLVPVTVNGWQQGWLLPAGTGGTVTLVFQPDRPYRIGLAGGLALLPLLGLLAGWPARRRQRTDPPAPPWLPRRWLAVTAAVAVGGLIAGGAGAAVLAAALGLCYRLGRHRRGYRAVTLGLSAGGLIAAGAVLSRYPWRSVDGYAGHWPSVQLLALVSVAVLTAAAAVGVRRR